MSDTGLHVVALSGGKDSTAMALRLREVHPERKFSYVCTPTGNEPPDLFDHWRKCEELLGERIVHISPQYDADGKKVIGWQEHPGTDLLIDLIRRQGMIPNFRARFCTRMLKIEPAQFWLKEHTPCTYYVGLRHDEPHRVGMYDDMPGVTMAYPFREWEWTVEDVWAYLNERGLKIPIRTDCELCFYQKLAEWKRLKTLRPEAFGKGVEIETETGHTFRSPSRDTWPAALAELADEFDTGRKVRGEDRIKDSSCDQQDLCRVCSL